MLTHNLRIFLEVANRQSITETANARYISQPAVSKAIQSLEKELSLKLFHRDKKSGMIPTEAGKKILLLARQMEDLENRIYQTAFRENNFIGGKLRIASVPVTTTVLLSKVLRQYREAYPYVTVEIKEGSPLVVRKMVEEHAVDFAVTYAPFGNLDAEILIRDEMVGILPPDSDTEIMEIGKETEHMILCRAGMETVMERLPSEQRIDFSRSLLVQNAETVVRMVDEGNGVGLISKFTLSSMSHHLRICQIQPTLDTQIGLLAYDLADLTPVAQEFARMMRELCAEMM
ncbi:LysR family transcriptional regulator [Schwartzia succinivorans]|jgi:DNA-binding transcriptional LysR family regulator|uniref:DNA-binding transcriptional regulator, LysR family n=1 Tax=Schwartzia succinivorans DSM 10502 TaxID=1123243 RepID=A0A1M4WI70_9FIRM|nr:LysR family transcriptional regulator [Schwartzia succinivorans]SHE80991.1 DNA-binding transcriptional regulator, LysR family [Schwartzia succinivorans DSM 10502]